MPPSPPSPASLPSHSCPLTGFNILIDAYIQALSAPSAFHRDEFIRSYCHRQYGFDAASSRLFQKALFTAPFRVVDGRPLSRSPVSLPALRDSARQASLILDTLRPLKNQREFEHYRLMAKIRVYYLMCRILEAAVNTDMPADEYRHYAGRARELMGAEQELNEKFKALNENTLYPSAIEEENRIRNYGLHRLYERLSGTK